MLYEIHTIMNIYHYFDSKTGLEFARFSVAKEQSVK